MLSLTSGGSTQEPRFEPTVNERHRFGTSSKVGLFLSLPSTHGPSTFADRAYVLFQAKVHASLERLVGGSGIRSFMMFASSFAVLVPIGAYWAT